MRLIIPALFALAGCSHSAPGVETQIVRIPVVRVTICIAVTDIPAVPAPLPARPANVSAALDLAVAKVLEMQGYAGKVDALLRGCAG